jgi:hypothetical protein
MNKPTLDELQATEQRLRAIIHLYAPSTFAAQTLWAAASAYAKAKENVLRRRQIALVREATRGGKEAQVHPRGSCPTPWCSS